MGASVNSRLSLEHRRLVPGGADSAIAAACGKNPIFSGLPCSYPREPALSPRIPKPCPEMPFFNPLPNSPTRSSRHRPWTLGRGISLIRCYSHGPRHTELGPKSLFSPTGSSNRSNQTPLLPQTPPSLPLSLRLNPAWCYITLFACPLVFVPSNSQDGTPCRSTTQTVPARPGGF